MGINAIINGHVNEMFKKNNSLFEKRMAICKQCPLLKESSVMGPVCNNKKWYNKDTGEISDKKKIGFKNGCGCRLSAKARLAYAICPLGKW